MTKNYSENYSKTVPKYSTQKNYSENYSKFVAKYSVYFELLKNYSVSTGGARNYSMSVPKLLGVYFKLRKNYFETIPQTDVLDMVGVARRDGEHHKQLCHAFP